VEEGAGWEGLEVAGGFFVGRDWEFLGVENGENRALGGD